MLLEMNVRRCLGLLGAASALLLLHCSASPSLCEGAACGSLPDGSTGEGSATDAGADAPAIPTPPGCDPNADAKDAPQCMVNDFALFVDAAGGADTNPGTKEAPLKSITAALGKLGNKPRIYLCGPGPYVESVKLASAVSLFGGFACGSWSHDGTKAKLAPAEPGYALHIDGVAGPIVLSDLDLVAKDAVAPGGSSIAVFISRASKVTLRRIAAAAGKAQPGSDGVDLAPFSPANAPDGTSGTKGGTETPNPDCPTSIGGAGGKTGAVDGDPGQVAISPVYPTTPAPATGAGGKSGGDCSTGLGKNGSYGVAGAAGTGALSLGTLDATGWKPTDGAPGGAGGHGQGGGGGAQIISGSGVGGSGGPGSCGGGGGAKGTAGGSSIALLLFESSLALELSSLSASDAARGGNGAKGQKAQLGNLAQAAANGAAACVGGYGGAGGSGGGGGGGAGGLSAGIVYKGTAPTIDGASTSTADTLASITLGAKGAAGARGLGGDPATTDAPASRAGQDGTAGIEGVAKAVMSTP
jgi:hypothetical protein